MRDTAIGIEGRFQEMLKGGDDAARRLAETAAAATQYASIAGTMAQAAVALGNQLSAPGATVTASGFAQGMIRGATSPALGMVLTPQTMGFSLPHPRDAGPALGEYAVHFVLEPIAGGVGGIGEAGGPSGGRSFLGGATGAHPTPVGHAGSEGFTTLYRAVSGAELYDIGTSGVMRSGPGSMGNKLFAESAAHASEWGRTFFRYDRQPFFTLRVRVPSAVSAKMFRWQVLDGIGPARSAEGHVLDLLNRHGIFDVLGANAL